MSEPAPYVVASIGEAIARVTSVRVETIGGHEHVSVWNRGALAGTLVVAIGDGSAIARRLMRPCDVEIQREEDDDE